MKAILFLFALIVISGYARGQSNFVKAVVLKSNGDSVYGNIDYRNWKNNPQTINFIDAANKKSAFNASSIRGFYIPAANETYTSFMVEMDMIPSDQFKAINNSFMDSSIVKRTVFLLQLIGHPALRLYQFIGDHKEHFYYVKGNEEPVELIHHYLYDESTHQLQENTTYKEQLSSLFGTCPNVSNKLKTIKFSRNEIQDIFLKYLQCSAPGSSVDIKKKDLGSFKFGLIAGLMVNTFNFKGQDPLVDAHYSGNLSPILGISFDLGLSRNLNKWHIINELIYKTYKTGDTFTRPYGSVYTATSDVSLGFSYAQINTFLRYIFQSKSPLKPFINFGIGNAFMISENKNNVHTVYSFPRSADDAKAIDGPQKYEFSLLGGVGLIIKSFQIELRYGSASKGFSPSYALDTNPRSYQFILTYKF